MSDGIDPAAGEVGKQNMEPLNPAIIDAVLNNYTQRHEIHKRGAIIFAGTGVGKSTYCKNQQPSSHGKTNFIDMDHIYKEAGAPPCEEHSPDTPGPQIKPLPWWTWGDDTIREVEKRCDIVNKALVDKGLWGFTTSFTPEAECQPAAIVLLPWNEHKRRIEEKWKEGNADGGAKPNVEGLKLARGHRKWTKKVAERNNIPVFDSIEKAVEYIHSQEACIK